MNPNTTTKMATGIISKSSFLSGLQCPKLLWTQFNARHLIPVADSQQQAVFDQGQEVENLAKKLFTNPIDVTIGIEDFDEVLRLSKVAIEARRPVFEATFGHEGSHARADILDPIDDDAWDIIEVKSSTAVKNVYIFDLAFQAYVFARAGLKIRRCWLMLINSDFVRDGEIDPVKFFIRRDLTAQVSAVSGRIGSKLEEMFEVVRSKQQPEISIGPRCNDPYPCPLIGSCWSHLPDGNVTTLYRGGAKAFKLLAQGITGMGDIPDDFPLTDNQEIQRKAAVSGQPHVDKAAIGEFLSGIEYPASFLDFETFSTAIPFFGGVGPYQQIPFQFSLHIVRSAGALPEHHSFLSEGAGDPRREFMSRLVEVLPENGSVVAYNATFELARLKECCELLPAHKPWLEGVKRRVVDLLLPFRGFKYYHPEQRGSCSMKTVLPALTGRTYENLAIQEGGTASREYLRTHFGDVADDDRQSVRRALENYCALDTAGMVSLVEGLQKLASN